MTPREAIDSAKLNELTQILDDYCAKAGIQNDREAREELALEIMSLFNSGINDSEEIIRSLSARAMVRPNV